MESFLSGRKSIAGTAHQPQNQEFEPLISARSAPPAPECGAPSVEAVEGPNGIERIIVTCECGKRIEVACLYE